MALRLISGYVVFDLLLQDLELNEIFLSAKNPVPVRCPVAGKFNFTQHGEHPFKTRFVEFSFLNGILEHQFKL